MSDREKTKAELLDEVQRLRSRVRALESADAPRPAGDGGPKLGGVLGAIDDLVFVFDTDRRFVFCNAVSGEARLIAPPEEFLGKFHDEVLPPDVNVLFSDAFERVRGGEVRLLTTR